MQEVLNKMVASVRHGVLGPKEASRAVHECAALLGLQLASEIPGSTLVISGLRKTSTAEDVIEAFRTFGEIEEAAVASNQRGFGKTPILVTHPAIPSCPFFFVHICLTHVLVIRIQLWYDI